MRQAQGFTAMALVEEYNLVRRCVFALAQEHCQQMDTHLLIQDLTQFGEALDLQTQRALERLSGDRLENSNVAAGVPPVPAEAKQLRLSICQK